MKKRRYELVIAQGLNLVESRRKLVRSLELQVETIYSSAVDTLI